MATATEFGWWDKRFFIADASGNLSAAIGYKLYQYASGTTTNQATYSDIAGTITNPNPIVLNSEGRTPSPVLGTPGLSYTFVLKDPTGTVVLDTWDSNNPAAAAIVGSFLPLTGGTLTGLLYLSGPATSSLGAVTKAQMDSADALTVASATDVATAATAAATAATAAAAAIRPESYFLVSASGAAVSRTITAMGVGTYTAVLVTTAHKQDSGTSTYSITVTQTATVNSASLATSFVLGRAGGSGYGRDAYGIKTAVGTFTLSAATDVTMAMTATALGAADSSGSFLFVYKS